MTKSEKERGRGREYAYGRGGNGWMVCPSLSPPPCPLLTISEERLRQLAEESLEQAADHIEVLPALRRSREIRTHACSSQVPMTPRPIPGLGVARSPQSSGLHACPEHNFDSS